MLWLILALGSGFCVAIANVITRKLANLDTFSLLYSRYLFAFLLSIFLLPFITITAVKAPFYTSIFIASCLDVIGVCFLIKAIKLSDLAKVFPLISFTPVFLIFSGFLILGEKPSLIGALGIAVVVLGAYLLGFERRNNLLQPFSMLLKERSARYMLLTAFLFSLVGPFLKKAILNSSPLLTGSVYFAISTVILTPIFLFNKSRIKECKENFPLLAVTGIALFFTLIFVLLALEVSLVAYVVSIKRFSILFTIVLGYFFFKEKDFKKNLIAGSVMVAGSFLIVIG